MLACNKCHQTLSERAAQQSLNEMEDTLLSRLRAIEAHHRAMLNGPLCDPCLAQWLREQRSETVSL